MATDFTQDAVLHFLQSSGGSVKNSDLLLHFRNFLRNHADQDRNRELFKKFVNTVATVRQQDGVSHVVLRKKFKGDRHGHVPGDGAAAGSSGPSRHPDWKSSPETYRPGPKPAALREGPVEESPRTTSQQRLPAAGLILSKTESYVKVKKQQQVNASGLSGVSTTSGLSTSGLSGVSPAQAVSQVSEKTSVCEPPGPGVCAPVSEQRFRSGSGPPPAAAVPAVRRHEEDQQVVPVPQTPSYQAPPPRGFKYRPSYKSAVSYDEDEDEEDEVTERRGSAGGAWPQGGPLGDTGRVMSTSLPSVIDTPVISSSSFSSGFSGVSTTSGHVSSAQAVSQVSENTQAKAVSVCEPPGPGVCAPVSERRFRLGSGPPPAAVPAVRRHEEDQQVVPVPQTVRGREACPQTEGGLHPRRFKYRPSYKSAMSCDEDEEEEEEVTESRGSSGGAWPQGGPLGDTSGSPAIISSSSSSSSERMVPKIYIQDAEGAVRPPPGPGLTIGSGAGLKQQWTGTGTEHMEERTSSRPSEVQHTPLPQDSQMSQAAGVHQELEHSPPAGLSSSRSSVLSPSPSPSPSPDVGSSRGSGWNSSYEELQARAGDSYDDHEEAVSSGGSTSSPVPRRRPAAARRLSSQVRNRMCLSLGADLDKVLQEEEEVKQSRGSEAARLNRLHLISSSLSLRYNLSSSSLSSCSTPPRCHSLADLAERDEPGKGRRSLPASATPTTPTAAHHESPSKQSLVPLESREHAWLVKGATGAWPDIYSLFREDSSLLNKQDFISGFTVLHWIAKHGDHRVLNTLWYGVQKAGLMFDINARSTCGHTPLHIAAMHGHRNIMRLLVNKFEADVKLRDTAGKRPWQYLNGNTPVDIFQLLAAPARAAVGGVRRADASWEQQQQQQQQQQQRRRRRHHLSTASGERPFTIAGAAKVKRSSSIAALLKHKSLRRFYGHQSDSSI